MTQVKWKKYLLPNVLRYPSIYDIKRNSVYLGIYIWDKVFKNGPSKIFKGYLPQILLDPFLITLPHFQIQLTFKFHK